MQIVRKIFLVMICFFCLSISTGFDRANYESNDSYAEALQQFTTVLVGYTPEFAEPPEIKGMWNKARAAVIGERAYWKEELKKIEKEISRWEQILTDQVAAFNGADAFSVEIDKTMALINQKFPSIKPTRADKLKEKADRIEEAETLVWIWNSGQKERVRLKEERDAILLFLPNLKQ